MAKRALVQTQVPIDPDVFEDSDGGGSEPMFLPPTPKRLRSVNKRRLPLVNKDTVDDVLAQSSETDSDSDTTNPRRRRRALADLDRYVIKDLASQLPRWSTERDQRGSSGRSPASSPASSVDLANQLPRWVTELDQENETPTTSKSPSPSVGTPAYSNHTDGLLRSILAEVKQANQKFDERLRAVEDTLGSLNESPPGSAKKLKPTPEIRSTLRKVYRSIQDDDPDFGWDTSVGVSASYNKDVLSKLVRETKSQLPDAPTALIKDAAKTYFNSVAGLEKSKESGDYGQKCVQQRRKNRLKRKLSKRLSALHATKAIKAADKDIWLPCLVPELMSSEESDQEQDDGEFIVRPLVWRSDKVTHFFETLDRKFKKTASIRSNKMTFARKHGLPSDRQKPVGVPGWSLK